MSKIEELRQELRTEEGMILQIQEQIARRTFSYLHPHGFLFDSLRNTMANNRTKEWVWETRYGTSMTFRNPYYRDMVATRSLPIERGRTAEEALSLTTSNRSEASISRTISKDHTIHTNATVTDTNTFNFNITAGITIGSEIGVAGTASNYGANALVRSEASLSTSFGGEFVRQWADEKGESTTRSVSDTLELEPLSEYNIVANVDKIDMEQVISTRGVIDFEIVLDLTEAHGQESQEHSFKLNSFTVSSVKDLARLLLGIIEDPIRIQEKWNREEEQHGDGWADNIRGILDTEYRTIESETTLSYKDAGDVSMTVIKVGNWENSPEGWQLNRIV